MGYISREDFQKLQEERSNNSSDRSGPFVGYFKLQEDNQEALVRFVYSDEEEIYNDIIITHKATVDGKFRRVNCLRNYTDPIDLCPMCQKGIPSQQRLYIRMIEYVRDEDNNIKAYAKVWERPTSYVFTLMDKFKEYGNLSDCIFKVRRHGKPGDMKTTYSIDFANPNIYNSTLYPKDFSAFEDYSIVGNAVLDLNSEELSKIADSTKPSDQAKPAGQAPWDNPSNSGQAPTQSAPRRVTY